MRFYSFGAMTPGLTHGVMNMKFQDYLNLTNLRFISWNLFQIQIFKRSVVMIIFLSVPQNYKSFGADRIICAIERPKQY